MSVIVLNSKGYLTQSTFDATEVDVKAWKNRSRMVFPAPESLLPSYLPLASKTFARMCPSMPQAAVKRGMYLGFQGLNLALDEKRRPVISIEAEALLELIQETTEEVPPTWNLQDWTEAHLFTAFHSSWRGMCSEHKVWSSILSREGIETKTPYSIPLQRSWVSTSVIHDLETCVGKAKIMEVAAMVKDMGFDGSPDLILWRPGRLWFVEVKSHSDRLKDNQLRMLRALSTIEMVTCTICCQDSKRFRDISFDDSD